MHTMDANEACIQGTGASLHSYYGILQLLIHSYCMILAEIRQQISSSLKRGLATMKYNAAFGYWAEISSRAILCCQLLKPL